MSINNNKIYDVNKTTMLSCPEFLCILEKLINRKHKILFTGLFASLLLMGVLLGSSNFLAYATIDIPTPVNDGFIDDGKNGFTLLDGAWGITTVVIDSTTYALVASSNDNGVQIIDISDPTNPTEVSGNSIKDGLNGFTLLSGARDITTVVIDSTTYALVASYYDAAVQIIDISDPASPTPVNDGFIDDGKNGFTLLSGARDITTVVIDSTTYALVASDGDNSVQIIDISDPFNPTPVNDGFIKDERNGFTLLSGAFGITTAVIDNTTYALVASNANDAVQIIDISDPFNPTPVNDGYIVDETNGFTLLDGARHITTAVIDNSTYALVASYTNNSVQIIDISDPFNPTPVNDGYIVDERNGFTLLNRAYDITIAVIDNTTYALVASYDDHAVQIIDISDPFNPTPVNDGYIKDETNGFTLLNGAVSITTVVIDSNTYALVTGNIDDGVQIIDISYDPAPTLTITTDPISPSNVSTSLVYTFDFSEAVTDFTIDDITLNFAGNGTGPVDGSNFKSTTPQTYTLTLDSGNDATALALLESGQSGQTVVATVDMTGLTDVSGNAGIGTESNIWTYVVIIAGTIESPTGSAATVPVLEPTDP